MACNGNTINANGTSGTLNPGVYCGGITVSGNGVSATFSSGTYILLGGGLQIKGGANATGSGVMFYNTYNSTYSYSPIVVSASSTTLSAPTSGTYEGVLFFQDRNIPTKDTGPSGPPEHRIRDQLHKLHRGIVLSEHAPGLFRRKCDY